MIKINCWKCGRKKYEKEKCLYCMLGIKVCKGCGVEFIPLVNKKYCKICSYNDMSMDELEEYVGDIIKLKVNMWANGNSTKEDNTTTKKTG